MKTLPLLLLSFALWCVALPPRAVQAQETVSFELFYDSLDPYGEWIEVDDYGYCWRPYAAMDDAMWRPYSDGSWAHTDGGWTWVSNEDFGWATYHYGRWARVIGVGWVWVPGYEWAPAWVSWRDTPDKEYVGWAPLPPEARFEISIGFNTWVDDYYDIGPSCYNFVRYRDFGEPRLRTVIMPYERNVTIINNSINITHISYRDSIVNNVYIGGPQYGFVRERSAREVRDLKLRRRDDFDFDRMRRDPKEYGRAINHREGDNFLVAAPNIRRFRDDERREPTKVKERVTDRRIDRGWDGVKDPAVAQRIRERMRQDGDRTRPQVMPEKVIGGRERDGRIGANDDRDQKGRDNREGREMNRDDRRTGPGALPGGGRDERVTPGGASQADIARRLEEEKKLREQRGGTAMDDRERKRNNDEDGRVGRPGGAPPDMADRREKERRDAIESEQRRRAMEGEDAAKKKEMADRERVDQDRGEKMKVDAQREKERQAAMESKKRDDSERMQRDREEKMRGDAQQEKERQAAMESKKRDDAVRTQREREGSEQAAKERMEGERRKAMESRAREQNEGQERMRNVEREKQQRAVKEAQDRQRAAAEGAQRREAENGQRKAMEDARRRSDDSQREAAERSRRAAEEGRRQQMQSQQRRAEESRPQPQPQIQRREDNPPAGGREGGKRGHDKDDEKEKEKGRK
jgi:hypothetical protein